MGKKRGSGDAATLTEFEKQYLLTATQIKTGRASIDGGGHSQMETPRVEIKSRKKVPSPPKTCSRTTPTKQQQQQSSRVVNEERMPETDSSKKYLPGLYIRNFQGDVSLGDQDETNRREDDISLGEVVESEDQNNKREIPTDDEISAMVAKSLIDIAK